MDKAIFAANITDVIKLPGKTPFILKWYQPIGNRLTRRCATVYAGSCNQRASDLHVVSMVVDHFWICILRMKQNCILHGKIC